MKHPLYILTIVLFLAGCTNQPVPSEQKTEPTRPSTTQHQTNQTNSQTSTYTEHTSITETPQNNLINTETKNIMFHLDGITLQAPEHYHIEITDTPHLTFSAYAEYKKEYLISELIQANTQDSLSDTELARQIKQFEGRYSFQQTNINGFDILIHKRDFFGLIGDVYEAHIYVDAGKVLILTDELDHTQLDQTLRTIKK